MAHNLDQFITNFQGGTRSHRYRISAGEIPGSSDAQLDRFHVRALELPPSQVNPIRIPYRGRILKWAGDRLYFPWTIRILDDKGAVPSKLDTVWNAFHNWSNAINDHETNIHNTPGGLGQGGIDDWTADWTIQQVDGDDSNSGDGTVLKEINLMQCWPTTIGPISLDANSVDQLVEFTVTMEYQYYTITTPGINSDGSGGEGGSEGGEGG